MQLFYRQWQRILPLSSNAKTIAAIVCFSCILTSCSTSNYAPVSDLNRSEHPVKQGFHRVKKGETLYSIAWRYKRNYKELAAFNGIKYPYSIYPDQLVNLAPKSRPKKKRVYSPKRNNNKNTALGYKKKANKTKKIQEKFANQRHNIDNITWRWPGRGRLIARFSTKGIINKGVDLAGERGDPVLAAADGKVVYSGQGLVGYGNLIIIKHNDNYLSAYAHNSILLIKEGSYAKAGQKIAEVGSSGTHRNKLHFEVRRKGKPVDPLKYLPKR